MIIIRDRDTTQERAARVLQMLSLDTDDIVVLDEQHDPLSCTVDDCVLFLTSMPTGCLGYQKAFFEKHCRRIPLWAVLLLNGDDIIFRHLDVFFHSDGLRRRIFRVTADTEWEALRGEVERLTAIKPRKALLYSIRPGCGKRSLIRLLAEDMPGWEFQAEEDCSLQSSVPDTDAGQILIVGQTLSDIGAVQLPAGVEPYYVLTMPDLCVQAYLNRVRLSGSLLAGGNLPATWTEEITRQHLFYVSPLYEGWYRMNTDPRLDDRFVMWDRFGLPCRRRDYTEENVRGFLSGFRQCRELAETLLSTI